MTIRESGTGFEVTLAQPGATIAASSAPSHTDDDDTAAADTDTTATLPLGTRYAIGAELGRGGMGDIVVGKDRSIGRDVAIKRMQATAPSRDQVERFLREARIQARLEHPAIVPVYELGRDPDGRPYFAMKRIAGVTLAQSLVAAPPPPRQRLLRVFADICRAVELAHARGVVHRDLKPANIMLGAYGEVYVLDWGLARVTGDSPDTSATREMRADIASLDDLDGHTQAGVLLGTPGFMAPEQAEGKLACGPAADVYALGAILFEILAGESLHPRGIAAAITATMTLSPDGAVPRRAAPTARSRPSSTRSAWPRSRAIPRPARARARSPSASRATSTAIAISSSVAGYRRARSRGRARCSPTRRMTIARWRCSAPRARSPSRRPIARRSTSCAS